MKNKAEHCNPESGCCNPSSNYTRRNFIKISALGTAFYGLPLSAYGVVSITKSGHLIPEDKKLSAEWIKSLTYRGLPETYSLLKDELKYIGMPIGGICCGQLYISGDGRLWLWDIFQSNYTREKPARPDHPNPKKRWRLDQFSMGGLYQKPRTSSEENNLHEVENGFAIRYQDGKDTWVLPLNKKGFEDIIFRGEYPVAKIEYKKESLPFTIGLTAYSPFIPLNVKDSGIPATIMSFEITNTGNRKVALDIGGWLENTVCPEIVSTHGKRVNNLIKSKNKTSIFMAADGNGLNTRIGYGDMAISLLGNNKEHTATTIKNINECNEGVFVQNSDANATVDLNERLVGGLSTSITLKSGQSKTVTFLVSWYFPYYNEQPAKPSQMAEVKDLELLKRHYANHYSNASDVASYVADEFDRLSGTTLKWNKTWYDSTLPYWFLDRSFISLDCLASQTSHLFDSGRFWGWEGVECCTGTCIHVWQYAQGMARIFPSLERGLRERVDYDIAYDDGLIHYRGENGKNFAVDGQLGTIIRVYREHKMAKDKTFLKNLWPRVKESMQYIIEQDMDGDGLLEGKQPHTLDAAWFGPMGWISGLYLAALKSCEQMAIEMDDTVFAKTCNEIIPIGQKNMVGKLFNGEYFIHLPPDYDSINTNKGCHIDQVLGQSFAHQVNLPSVLPKKETTSALKALWKYNFAPDAGQYALDHKAIKGERIYAMPGEAALMMTTWPMGGDDKAVPGMADRPDDTEHWIGPGGYFDEAMNGFEYQVASHMVWEGMLIEGLSIMKAVHERYNGSKRNPYDEVECSSHYSRSMASYGTFIAASGFSYHGPKRELGFAPKISPENFKCAFTAAEGWGAFTQHITNNAQSNSIILKYGQLRLNKFSIRLPNGASPTSSMLEINGKSVEAKGTVDDRGRYIWALDSLLNTGDMVKTVVEY